MIPLKQVLTPQEMKAIFVNLEVRPLSFCATAVLCSVVVWDVNVAEL